MKKEVRGVSEMRDEEEEEEEEVSRSNRIVYHGAG
jgi:hypothetical protein